MVTKLYLLMAALFIAKVIYRVCKTHHFYVTDWHEIGTPPKLNARFANVSGQLLVSLVQTGRFCEHGFWRTPIYDNVHCFWGEPRAEQGKLSIEKLRRSWPGIHATIVPQWQAM